MIKINLLPAAKKAGKATHIKFGLNSYVTLFIIAVAAVILIEGFTWYWLNSRISSRTTEKQTLETRLAGLKEKVKEVENYEKDKKTFEQKIAIIQNLKKGQKGPVHVLDEISRMLPERVWLVSLKEKGADISITGSGMTNDDIVRYVNNLKTSSLFRNIQLIESRQVVDSGIPVYSFSLTFSVNLDTV
ncbi:MAG: PilN domain-containing protein [Nitrospirae bacterium]|nr:PilN domain-containing protein [Nitrospirota bacterium]